MSKLTQLLNELAVMYPYNDTIQEARSLATLEQASVKDKFIFSVEELINYTKTAQLAVLKRVRKDIDPSTHSRIDAEIRSINEIGESTNE